MKTDKKDTPTTNLPAFILKVEKQDNLFRVVYMAIIILYLIIIVAQLAIVLISVYNNIPFIKWMSNLGILIPFLIILYYLNKRYIEYKRADYSLPSYSVLKNMEKRYRAFRPADLWVLAGLIILGISMGIDNPMGFINFQLGYWTMMLVAMLGGHIYWRIKIKPLRDNALQLLKELDE